MKAALTTENSIPALFDLLKIYEEETKRSLFNYSVTVNKQKKEEEKYNDIN